MQSAFLTCIWQIPVCTWTSHSYSVRSNTQPYCVRKNLIALWMCGRVCVWAVSLWRCDSHMTGCNCLLHSNQRGVNNASRLMPSCRHLLVSSSDSGSNSWWPSARMVHACAHTHARTHACTHTHIMVVWSSLEKNLKKKKRCGRAEGSPVTAASDACMQAHSANPQWQAKSKTSPLLQFKAEEHPVG